MRYHYLTQFLSNQSLTAGSTRLSIHVVRNLSINFCKLWEVKVSWPEVTWNQTIETRCRLFIFREIQVKKIRLKKVLNFFNSCDFMIALCITHVYVTHTSTHWWINVFEFVLANSFKRIFFMGSCAGRFLFIEYYSSCILSVINWESNVFFLISETVHILFIILSSSTRQTSVKRWKRSWISDITSWNRIWKWNYSFQSIRYENLECAFNSYSLSF